MYNDPSAQSLDCQIQDVLPAQEMFQTIVIEYTPIW